MLHDPMSLDLTNFGLDAMLRCGLGVRRSVDGTTSLEAAATAMVRYLYDACRAPEGGTPTSTRSCVLVRCYLTQPFERLDPSVRAFARRALRDGSRGALRDTPSGRTVSTTEAASALDDRSDSSDRVTRDAVLRTDPTPVDPTMRCLTLLATAGTRPTPGGPRGCRRAGRRCRDTGPGRRPAMPLRSRNHQRPPS